MVTKVQTMDSPVFESGDTCYAFVGDTCISGTVESVQGEAATVRLVTGHRVSRLLSELRAESPRLEVGSEWPI
ncbi:MAG: hypothetical protein ABGZ35_23215 [Planctomycetaceae bacterium]